MPTVYKISALAEAVGIPISTIRYYERVGLIEPEDRSQGNYRLYGDESLRKLQFIRAAQATGFTLNDVKSLLGNSSGETPSCGNVQSLIKERLSGIDERLRNLRHVQKVLKSALKKCRATERHGKCQVIETLQESK